jgi:hypothetical protein
MNAPRRPEYVSCVLLGRADQKHRTWCGRQELGFAFVDAGHAALHVHQRGRLLVCQECADALTKVIAEGRWDGTGSVSVRCVSCDGDGMVVKVGGSVVECAACSGEGATLEELKP